MNPKNAIFRPNIEFAVLPISGIKPRKGKNSTLLNLMAAKKPLSLSVKEIAWHEAAHAVVGIRKGLPILDCYILGPRHGGRTRLRPSCEGIAVLRFVKLKSGGFRMRSSSEITRACKRARRAYFRRHIVMVCAGPIAHLCRFPIKGWNFCWGTHNRKGDSPHAAQLLIKYWPEANAVERDKLFMKFFSEAKRLVMANFVVIRAVARELQRQRRLSGKAIQNILKKFQFIGRGKNGIWVEKKLAQQYLDIRNR